MLSTVELLSISGKSKGKFPENILVIKLYLLLKYTIIYKIKIINDFQERYNNAYKELLDEKTILQTQTSTDCSQLIQQFLY